MPNVYTNGTYTHRIAYNTDGGSAVSNTSASKSSNASSVTVYTTVSSYVPTKSGYSFLGWNTKSDGSGVTADAGTQRSYTFSRSATYDHTDTINGVEYDYYTVSNQSHTTTLYAQWKASSSTVSASDGDLGTAQTLTITAIDPSATHTLRYSFAGHTGTIASGISSSYNWTPPLSWADYIPSAGSGTCTIYCDTYVGGELYGTSETTVTLSVPSTVKCTVSSVAIAETVAGINSKFGAFVQTKSKVSVTGTFTGGSGSPTYGATVASVSISINGQTLNTNGAVTNFLTTSGTNSYTVTITDTRGRTDTYSGTYSVLAYTAPSVFMSAERDANTSTTINVTYSWSISACSNLNDKAITITYAKQGGTETDIQITPATYSGSTTYAITGTDASELYDITVSVADYFTEIRNGASVSATGSRIVHASCADLTLALHGANPEDGSDHEYFPIEFHDNVIGILLKYLGETQTIAANATVSYTLANSTAHLFFVYGDSANNMGFYFVFCDSSGNIRQKTIEAGNNLTSSTSANTFSVKSGTYAADILHLVIS